MENIDSFFVFQTDSNLVKESLNNPNYLIEHSDIDSIYKDNYCAIYFSSNNIYYPNTKFEFQKQILNKNRFEWYGERIQKASKHIFIRDNKKQWYLEGINNDINSIEKLEVFLKSETKGYKTLMIGSSAGGYAAVLFGSLLKSEYIFSFNGQFKLYDLLKSSNESIDPIIFREKNNPTINQYFSLKKVINNPSIVYYFYSNKSSWDITNKKHIENINLNIIAFNTSNHGIPFLRSALPFVINASIEKINSWNKKTFNPIYFSFKYGGIFSSINVLYKKILVKLKHNFFIFIIFTY